MIAFAVVLTFVLNRTTFGRKVFSVGGNEEAAILSGIRTKRVVFLTTTLCSTLCGVAGIIYMARFGSAQPTFGIGMELNVIAAVVLGAAQLTGCRGTVIGTVLGVILVVIANNSLILIGIAGRGLRPRISEVLFGRLSMALLGGTAAIAAIGAGLAIAS